MLLTKCLGFKLVGKHVPDTNKHKFITIVKISNEKWKDQSMICKYMFSVMKIYLCIFFKNHSTKVSKLYYQNQKYCFANFSILLSIIHLMKSARYFFCWHSLWFKLWTCIVVYLYDLYLYVCNYYQFNHMA